MTNPAPPPEDPILQVSNLRTYFHTEDGIGRAVDGVSFQLARGQTLGLVGESGCGKSVTALSVLRLVAPPGYVEGGQIHLRGRDLLQLPDKEMRKIRGDSVAMIFQEPMTSLNPVLTCGDQIAEAVRLHQGVSADEARLRAIEMMRHVGIPAPEQRVDEYPHQLSGGMRQRVGIAQTLLHMPRIIVVDEPTAGLDPLERIRFRNMLARVSQNRIVVFSTHIVEDISGSCNQLAVLDRGALLYTGSPASMRALAQGKIWEAVLEEDPFARVEVGLNLVSHVRTSAGIRTRFLHEIPPDIPQARPVEATLEDAYLYLLRSGRVA